MRSIVRRSPKSCTSSAPKVETPTSLTQSGSEVTLRISRSLQGHSWICQWFQSSGNPCRAMTSIFSRTPCRSMRWMNSGSIGEIPPRTHGMPGETPRTASAARRVIVENVCHSGSSSKSQCERLFGSFHNITASIMIALCVLDVGAHAGAADVHLVLGMIEDHESRAAQHGFHAGPVRNPPVRRIAGIALLHEVHPRIAALVEDGGLRKRIVVGNGQRGWIAALHALEDHRLPHHTMKDVESEQ